MKVLATRVDSTTGEIDLIEGAAVESGVQRQWTQQLARVQPQAQRWLQPTVPQTPHRRVGPRLRLSQVPWPVRCLTIAGWRLLRLQRPPPAAVSRTVPEGTSGYVEDRCEEALHQDRFEW
eukprot:Opistho-2@83085